MCARNPFARQVGDKTMKTFMAAGLTLLAGAALLETALIPGLVIGGAAVLAPKYLPKLQRRAQSSPKAKASRQAEPAGGLASQPDTNGALAILAKLGIKQAVAKTITFRVLVTALDFTTNYVVIGEVTTAAGLSTLGFVIGPLLYLTHEAAWNYLGPTEDAAVAVKIPLSLQPAETSPVGQFTMSRALAKTITFRTIATVVDFTTIYVVVGDVLTAAGLSAFAFVVGPFVYLGHEKLWDYYGSPKKGAPKEPTLLLPAPPSSVPASG
jgi:uncharacterized membrane protein